MWSWLSRKSRPIPGTSPASARPRAQCCISLSRLAFNWTIGGSSGRAWIIGRILPGAAGPIGWRFKRNFPSPPRLWLIESHGARHYAEVEYRPDDYLVFGRETAGLPRTILEHDPNAWLRRPHVSPTSALFKSFQLRRAGALRSAPPARIRGRNLNWPSHFAPLECPPGGRLAQR